MPEATAKFYPVLARIQMLLDGQPLVIFRAAVLTRTANGGVFNPEEYRLVHRFVMEYKGQSFPCGEQLASAMRELALEYLNDKCAEAKRYEHKILEPLVEIEIPLRDVKPKRATAA